MTENSDQLQKPWQFKKGISGNPRGKPPGARNKATLAAAVLLDGEAEALSRKAIELALAGDTFALRLCLERIVPPRKDRPISFKMPIMRTARDAADLMSSLLSAVAAGDVTPDEADRVSKLVATFVKALEAHDFESRIAALERAFDRDESDIEEAAATA